MLDLMVFPLWTNIQSTQSISGCGLLFVLTMSIFNRKLGWHRCGCLLGHLPTKLKISYYSMIRIWCQLCRNFYLRNENCMFCACSLEVCDTQVKYSHVHVHCNGLTCTWPNAYQRTMSTSTDSERVSEVTVYSFSSQGVYKPKLCFLN